MPTGSLPTLVLGPTGEKFEMLGSSRSETGLFEFRWTLAPGKAGPPEHIHPTETEAFEIESGTLRIWIEGAPQDLHPGDRFAVPPGVRHRFLNPGTTPMITRVRVDGPRLEDTLVPFALYLGGRENIRIGEMLRAAVHEVELPPATIASSRVLGSIYTGIGRGLRWFGVRGFPITHDWARGG